jgi:hypothetical protein
MGQVSIQGIRQLVLLTAHLTCYPCIRSTLLPFYPVQTTTNPTTHHQPPTTVHVCSENWTIVRVIEDTGARVSLYFPRKLMAFPLM